MYRVIRDWILIPDSYGGWVPFAYKKGKEVIKSNKIDIILATFPYASNALVTYLLYRKLKVPYVIDFRDAWLDDPYVRFTWWLQRKVHSYLERKIVTSAARVIVYGRPLQNIFEEKYPVLKGKVRIITNGFDPEDFENLTPIKRTINKVRIVYSGSVYVDRRETFANFIKSVSLLSKRHKDNLEIIFVGDILQWSTDLVEKNQLNNIISFTGYLDHTDALNYLASADVALLFLKPGDIIAYTGKIFEYLGLGLPVMACVEEEGACATLLKSINHNQGVVSPRNFIGMKEKLEEIIDKGLPRIDSDKAKIYSRKFHAEKLNEILREIV